MNACDSTKGGSPKLQEISFVEINVEDGDLSPCLGLDYVGFFNKRHYSHTVAEVDAIIAERQAMQKKKKVTGTRFG